MIGVVVCIFASYYILMIPPLCIAIDAIRKMYTGNQAYEVCGNAARQRTSVTAIVRLPSRFLRR